MTVPPAGFASERRFMRTLLPLVLLGFATSAHADHWPAWRGPRNDGASAEKTFPLKWSETENVRWKVEIPGVGHSSPIVWGDRIFLTSCDEKTGDRLLVCLDRDKGAILWQRTVLTSKLERKHKLNSHASSTPATDGTHVWVAFLDDPAIRVACYDFAGNPTWSVSPGKFFSPHGFCSSPILYKDFVIVNCDQDKQEAFLVALDRKTGKERWRIDRPNRIRSYCVPLIVEAAGKTQMVLSGCNCVTSYDPDTGKPIWIIQGPTEQYVASLVYDSGVFF